MSLKYEPASEPLHISANHMVSSTVGTRFVFARQRSEHLPEVITFSVSHISFWYCADSPENLASRRGALAGDIRDTSSSS